jgi:phosphoglycerate kinase
MAKKTIREVDVAGKRALIRVDFNVPIEEGKITDDRRIRMALPTIRSALEHGASVVLMSHLGRPAGVGYEASESLKPAAERLAQLLAKAVLFPSNDCVDGPAAAAVAALKPGQVLLLENLRFHRAEKKGDAAFAAKLAVYGDLYVNDAFGTCHRPDASMVAVPLAMKGKPRVVGLLVERELRYLSDALKKPKRPFVVVLGGAKVADKLPVIENLLPKADSLLIGGAMAYTFLKAAGHGVGASRVETDRLVEAKRILDLAALLSKPMLLPHDHICSNLFAEHGGDVRDYGEEIGAGYMGLDIGPRTQVRYSLELGKARTIVWNGPMGVFEWAPFRVGTMVIAKVIAETTVKNGAVSIVGGGDSAAAAEMFGVAEQFSHVSTGGGASLEMLAGVPFQSVELLDEA